MSNGTVIVTATANDASGVNGTTVITISNQSSAGIDINALSAGLKMYPNPVNSIVNIEANEEIQSIVFFNLMGERVKTIASPTTSIDVSDLAKGVYMLQVTAKNIVDDLEDYTSFATSLAQLEREKVARLVIDALESSATITDNRALYY